MKSYHEIAENVFKRRKEYLVKKRRRQRILYYSITSLCVVAVLAVGLYLPQKPQEIIFPSSQSQPHHINSFSSQATSSLPYNNSSSYFENIQSTVTSLPQIEYHPPSTKPSPPNHSETSEERPFEPTLSSPNWSSIPSSLIPEPFPPSVDDSTHPEYDEPVESIPPTSNVLHPPASSEPSSPSSAPSVSVVEYQTNFSTLKQFEAFLPKLDIEIKNSQVEVGTKIPEITTPAPDQGFWDNLDSEHQPSKPESSDVTVQGFPTAPKPPTNKEIWDVAKNMFDNGYYSVPYLQNGNDMFVLERIYIQKDTIKYNYRFQNDIPNTQNWNLLSVQLYDYSIKGTYSSYLGKYDYKIINDNGITYTAFRMNESNMYNACVIWEQNGFWCRANYLGEDKYLSSIIPNLYLVQLPWAK